MKNKEQQKFYLAMESLPGDNALIDISKLSIANNYNPYFLEEIDSFTMHFTEEEIIAAIKEVNIINNNYFDGKLCICDNQKHKPLKVITKDYLNNFELRSFITDALENKNTVNTLINKFEAIVKEKDISVLFKNSVKNKNVDQIVRIIVNTEYKLQRKFILYMIDLNNKLNNKKDKKYEKVYEIEML